MTAADLHGSVLVIGYGNTLRGDDGFGPAVASLLERSVDGIFTILAPQQLTPDLAAQVAGNRITILIDAEQGDEPGRIHHRLIRSPDWAPVTYQHHITPEVLAGVTDTLYGVQPEMHLFTVEAASFDFGEGLSPAVSASVKEVAGLARQLVEQGE